MILPLVTASSVCYNSYYFPDGPWYTPEGIYIKPTTECLPGATVSVEVFCTWPKDTRDGVMGSMQGPTGEFPTTPEELRKDWESHIRNGWCP